MSKLTNGPEAETEAAAAATEAMAPTAAKAANATEMADAAIAETQVSAHNPVASADVTHVPATTTSAPSTAHDSAHDPDHDRFAVGIASALVGAALWGISGACTQYLFAHYAISSLFITLTRLVGAGILFAILLAVRYRDIVRTVLGNRTDRRRLLLFGCVGLYSCQVTYVIAIGYTNAGTATVLQATNIVIVMVASCALLRRRPVVGEVIGLVCACIAVVLVATKGDFDTLNLSGAGMFWGLASAFCVAFYIMYPQRLFATYRPLPIIGMGMIAAAVTALGVWLIAGGVFALSGGTAGEALALPELDAMGVFMLVIIAVVGTFAAFALFLYGTSIVGSVKGSLLGAVEPVSATVFSLVQGTLFTVADWVGLALMIATVFLVTLGGSKKG
jgi:drug/metabolite transporter (DMT)-like permease